jgi:hypothetical protein
MLPFLIKYHQIAIDKKLIEANPISHEITKSVIIASVIIFYIIF